MQRRLDLLGVHMKAESVMVETHSLVADAISDLRRRQRQSDAYSSSIIRFCHEATAYLFLIIAGIQEIGLFDVCDAEVAVFDGVDDDLAKPDANHADLVFVEKTRQVDDKTSHHVFDGEKVVIHLEADALSNEVFQRRIFFNRRRLYDNVGFVFGANLLELNVEENMTSLLLCEKRNTNIQGVSVSKKVLNTIDGKALTEGPVFCSLLLQKVAEWTSDQIRGANAEFSVKRAVPCRYDSLRVESQYDVVRFFDETPVFLFGSGQRVMKTLQVHEALAHRSVQSLIRL